MMDIINFESALELLQGNADSLAGYTSPDLYNIAMPSEE